MDVYCPICGEPWDLDSLHEEAGERYGIPFHLPATNYFDGRRRELNPRYSSDDYARVFDSVRAEFRSKGCRALACYGASCSTPSTETDRTFGLTRQAAAGAMYDLLGDDMDGAAAMLEDLGF